MKKVKTFNKLLSSLTLLSPLTGIGFNNQYENTQKVITENNNALNNYFSTNVGPVQMGDIYVNLDDTGKIIQSYASGTGILVVSSDITSIVASAFKSNTNITGLDLSNATSLTTIGDSAFQSCTNLTGGLMIPSSITTIGSWAFFDNKITSLDLSEAINLTNISDRVFYSCTNLTGNLVIPSKVTSISEGAFSSTKLTSLDLSQATSLTTIGSMVIYHHSGVISGDLTIPSSVRDFGTAALSSYDISNLYLLPTSKPSFNVDWVSSVSGKIYVPEGQKQEYVDAQEFHFDSSQVEEWSFDSSSCSILGSFNLINIKPTDKGSTQTGYNLSGELSVEGLENCFAYELVPTESTQTIPNGLYFYDKKIYWNNVPTGYYQFKIKASLNENNFVLSDKTITINVNPYTPEPTKQKSNTGLILGLVFGLGIILLSEIAFITWYLTKKKKTTVKI